MHRLRSGGFRPSRRCERRKLSAGICAQGPRPGFAEILPTLFDAGHSAMVSKFARFPALVPPTAKKTAFQLLWLRRQPAPSTDYPPGNSVIGCKLAKRERFATDFLNPPSVARTGSGDYCASSERACSRSTRRLVKTTADSPERCDSSGHLRSSSRESSWKSVHGAEVVWAKAWK